MMSNTKVASNHLATAPHPLDKHRILVILTAEYGHLRPLLSTVISVSAAAAQEGIKLQFDVLMEAPNLYLAPAWTAFLAAAKAQAHHVAHYTSRYAIPKDNPLPGSVIIDHLCLPGFQVAAQLLGVHFTHAKTYLFFSSSAAYLLESGYLDVLPATVQNIIIATRHTLEPVKLAELTQRMSLRKIRVWPVGYQKQPFLNFFADGATPEKILTDADKSYLLVTHGSASFMSTKRSQFLATALQASKSTHHFVFPNPRYGDEPLRENLREHGILVEDDYVDQCAFLGHLQVRGLVAHGGWSSVCEAIDYQKPMLVYFEVGLDQHVNAAEFSSGQFPIAVSVSQNLVASNGQHLEQAIAQFESKLPILTKNIQALHDRLRLTYQKEVFDTVKALAESLVQ